MNKDSFFKGKEIIACPCCGHDAKLIGVGTNGQIYFCTNRERVWAESKLSWSCWVIFTEKSYYDLKGKAGKTPVKAKRKPVKKKLKQ